MGTHPIFESDFDCLTEMSEMETENVEVKPPAEKRARFSKNKKRNWGKFDQTEIDEALETKRRNEVLHGASDLAEVKDEDLFVIDRGNKKKEPKKVMTRTQRLLENKSKVEAPLPIEDQPLPNRAKYLMDKKETRKNRTLNLRKQAAQMKKSSKQHETERTSLNNTYDLWGSGAQNIPSHSGLNVDSNKNFRATDHSKEIDGRSRVKRPERMKYKPERAKKIDSVVPAHGGASYNPDYDAHQHLLRQEDTKEEIRVSHEDKIRRKAKPPPKSEQVTEEDIFKESVAGLGIISDEEYETEEEEDQEPKPIKKPIRAEDRKDKKDRRKEKKQIIQVLRARKRKRMRILMNQVFQVKRLKRELKAEQEELEKKRLYRKEKTENKMPRLSNMKWDESKVAHDIKLTEELTSTLRELVPEGSVMTERYQSFVNRAMIEPRQKHKNKKKFKVKYQEKRIYREFADKFGKELAKE